MQFGFGIRFFRIFFIAALIIVVGGIVAIVVKMILQKRRNDRSPIVTKHAEVASKRTDRTSQQQPVAGDVTGAHGFHHMSFTTYYVRFRTEDGAYAELPVEGSVYEQLNEGDRGTLTYQGTRFLGFSRD